MRPYFLCAAIACGLSAPAWSLTIGAIGDSLTDEYLGYAAPITSGVSDFAAKNWVQILAETRGADLNLGALETDETVRGEPRGKGYEYNWARAGATATSPGLLGSLGLPDFANLSEQAANLRNSVVAGQIDVVFAAIGANDFLVRNGLFGVLPAQSLSGPDYDSWEANLIHSIFSPLDDLHSAGANHILLGLIPGTADSGADSAALREAINHANSLLIEGAAARGYRVVDWFGWQNDPARRDAEGNLLVGGLVIAPGAAGVDDLVPAGTPGAGPCNSAGLCAGPSHALYQRVEDGIHPNTIMQALMANEILGAINEEFNLDIAPLSDREIVQLSGATVPLPATLWLFGGALLGLRSLSLRRR